MFRPEVLDPAVRFLAARAGTGPVLELAIGTGRVALPLAATGLVVHGIDISEPMLDQLRAKPGAEQIRVWVGDLATTRLTRQFSLVYLVFNGITNLTTQDEQVACFENSAAHLLPGGRFVVEVFVPDLRRVPPGERGRVFALSETHVGVDEYIDLVEQTLRSRHYWTAGDELRSFASTHRYVWPSELDLMARIAGMELCERFAGFGCEPFTGESRSHVSVWKRPE